MSTSPKPSPRPQRSPGGGATVYFDTQFFVWLKSKDDATVVPVIRDLIDMGIRPVCTQLLVAELMHGSDANRRRNHRLFESVSMLGPALSIPESASWAALRLDADVHRPVVKAFLLASSIVDQVGATCAAADDPRSLRAWAAGNQGAIEHLQKPGELQRLLAKVAQQLRESGVDDSEQLALARLENAGEEPARPDLLQEVLGDEAAASLDLGDRLRRSALMTDNRLTEVARGGPIGKLPNTLRDTQHMQLFAEHAAEIDLLQVDKAQMELMKRGGDRHEMVRLGLAERCFQASDLAQTVGSIRALLG